MSKQYPEQNGEYIVKVKSSQSTHRWSDFDRVRLQISVGQEYHEGTKLNALFNWAAGRFDKILVCVNDTLQRHNRMFLFEETASIAQANASKAGQDWAKRNAALLEEEKVVVKHWDEWRSEPKFKETMSQINWLYTNNAEFKLTIDRNVMAIWNRRKTIDAQLYTLEKFARFAKLSTAYLLEETAVFSMMYDDEEAIDAYPGTVLFASTVFQGKAPAGAPAGLGKGAFSRVDFSKNKNYNPQTREYG